ncbi:hypothetical protein CEXT_707591 [Caerostris extrusa]|uniref:Uncharacterized protein n=1 Tax=Caerostris extrusa TaxID=172846 RepID=A0AAV4YA26_CAEEX|nr:hypothetical protein CEXT_707591 [Caerostris extrusa]
MKPKKIPIKPRGVVEDSFVVLKHSFFLLIPFRPIKVPCWPEELISAPPEMGGEGGGAQGIFNSSLDFPRASRDSQSRLRVIFIGNRSLVKGLFNGTREKYFMGGEGAFNDSREKDKAARGLGPGFFLLIPFRPIKAPVGPRNLSVHLPKWEVREVHGVFLIQAPTLSCVLSIRNLDCGTFLSGVARS